MLTGWCEYSRTDTGSCTTWGDFAIVKDSRSRCALRTPLSHHSVGERISSFLAVFVHSRGTCSFLKNQRFSVSCNVRVVISDGASSMTNQIADEYLLNSKQFTLQTLFDMPTLNDERAELQVEISSAPIFTRVRAELSLSQLSSGILQLISASTGSSIEASPSSQSSDAMDADNDEQQDEPFGSSPSKTFLGFLGMRPGKQRTGQYEMSTQEHPSVGSEEDLKDSTLECVSPDGFTPSYRSWFRPKGREADQESHVHSMSAAFAEDSADHDGRTDNEEIQPASAAAEKHGGNLFSPVGDGHSVAERRGWWWERKHKLESESYVYGERTDSPEKHMAGEAQPITLVWKEEGRVPALGLKGDFTLRVMVEAKSTLFR
eukprot:760800-Hanusia_phi.AAC.1